jgi:hypothetical protein
VDCVEDVAGVAEGGGLQRGRELDGRVLAEGRWGRGGRPRLGGWVCIVRGMGWVLRVCFYFYFLQEFERVESLALYLIRGKWWFNGLEMWN